MVKMLSHLPIILDPSQGTGLREIVSPISAAAIAAGADGLIIEVHNQPEEALSDGEQSLFLDQFENLLPILSSQANLRNKRFDYETNTLKPSFNN